MIVRGVLMQILAATALLPSLGVAQYKPRWHVGDWWIVKEQGPSLTGRDPHWQTDRYDVLGTQDVEGQDCFVLQQKTGDTTASRDGERFLYYIRTDNWRVIRMETYLSRAGKLRGPGVSNYPEGMSGFHPFGVWFPLFPLDIAAVHDSAFHIYAGTYGAQDLRQFASIADSALMNRYLSDPNPEAGRPGRLGAGKMFSVLSEMGASRESTVVPSVYNLQLWSTDYPWRLYEEEGQYTIDGNRQSNWRTWLIAWGHSGK